MRSTARHTGALDGRTMTWLTLVGLGVVLAAFGALVLVGGVRGSHEVGEVTQSADLAEAYLRAQDAMSREDTIEDLAEGGLDPALRDDFERAARDFDAAIAKLARSDHARDRRLAARASALHRRYAGGMRAAFAAAARGDGEAVAQINDERMDPAQDELQPLIAGTGPQHAVAQLEGIDDLREHERRELTTGLVAVPVGAALYVLLVLIFLRQRRRLDAVTCAEVSRLDEAAHTDSLTGLFNLRALQRDVAELPPGANAMAMLDVVGLKPVNDRQGHRAGDALLQSVAAALREEVAGRGRAYRIGGDEFGIVLPGGDETVAEAAVAAIRERVASRHPAGVRAGVAASDDPSELHAQASAALLGARRGGGLSRAA